MSDILMFEIACSSDFTEKFMYKRNKFIYALEINKNEIII